MSSPPQAQPFMSSAYPLLGEFEVAITGGVWVAAGAMTLQHLISTIVTIKLKNC